MWESVVLVVIFLVIMIGFAALIMAVKCWRKVEQGTALIITGAKMPTVHFSKAIVWPLIRRAEIMDISVKRIEIYRHGTEGLNCKDNIRADIKVAFFVRVNNNEGDVLNVAQTIGSERASDHQAMVDLFESKFSEGLKTVGKEFDFVELYTSREEFKNRMLAVIGTDLNGYVLDDAAIDYLEQTPLEMLNANNVLDAEGIKKITDKTAAQAVLANDITREKEKTIRKQDVEAREAILELDRQLAEAEEKQSREVAVVTARERAEAMKIEQEERLKAERARISTEEEVAIAEENKLRQVVVACKNKERTDQVETERVEKDRMLEVTERQRVVSLADIEKDKAIEIEKKAIQDVIRERVMVQRAVVEEEQKIKDTEEFATADRSKRVAITIAEQQAQEQLVMRVKAAEAARDSAQFQAEEVVIDAEAQRESAEKETAAKKMLAEGVAAEEAAKGIAEANVIEKKAVAEARGLEAMADAVEKEGTAESVVIEKKAVAEAKGLEAKAEAIEKEGTAEATVIERKAVAEAKGITDKAAAMKLFNDAGKEHEEYKLQLNKDQTIEIAAITAQEEIAKQQAVVMGEALKSAKIDIVGGESEFFDKIVSSITAGKSVDRWVDNSKVLGDVKNTFFNGDPEHFQSQLKTFISQFNLKSEDIKNLSIAALIGKMTGLTKDTGVRSSLESLLEMAKKAGLSDMPLG